MARLRVYKANGKDVYELISRKKKEKKKIKNNRIGKKNSKEKDKDSITRKHR